MAVPTSPIRRRVVFINRVEDRVPGRVAFVVYRGRTRSRSGALGTYRLLGEWLGRRQQRLVTETSAHSPGHPQPAPDETRRPAADPDGDDSATQHRASTEPDNATAAGQSNGTAETGTDRPDEQWTKGRLYELARAYRLAGRSKLDKASLYAAVTEEWDQRHSSTR